VPLLQLVLSGWVLYVSAGGLLSEGAVRILARRRAGADFTIASLACAAFLFSAVATTAVLIGRRPWFGPLLFHVVVLLLIAWNGLRCARPRA
jgi:hypothetical protein